MNKGIFLNTSPVNSAWDWQDKLTPLLLDQALSLEINIEIVSRFIFANPGLYVKMYRCHWLLNLRRGCTDGTTTGNYSIFLMCDPEQVLLIYSCRI